MRDRYVTGRARVRTAEIDIAFGVCTMAKGCSVRSEQRKQVANTCSSEVE
jgi:hypothetical protein